MIKVLKMKPIEGQYFPLEQLRKKPFIGVEYNHENKAKGLIIGDEYNDRCPIWSDYNTLELDEGSELANMYSDDIFTIFVFDSKDELLKWWLS